MGVRGRGTGLENRGRVTAAMLAPWTVRAPAAVCRALRRLDGPRVALRKPQAADRSGLAATMDDEVVRANGWRPEDVEGTLRAVGHRRVVRTNAWALIRDRHTDVVIGSISARPLDAYWGVCDVGWWLGPTWRGRGYGTETVGLVVAALHRVGVGRVVIGTLPDNTGVRRVAEKLGATELGTAPHTLPNGAVVESLWFAHDVH